MHCFHFQVDRGFLHHCPNSSFRARSRQVHPEIHLSTVISVACSCYSRPSTTRIVRQGWALLDRSLECSGTSKAIGTSIGFPPIEPDCIFRPLTAWLTHPSSLGFFTSEVVDSFFLRFPRQSVLTDSLDYSRIVFFYNTDAFRLDPFPLNSRFQG